MPRKKSTNNDDKKDALLFAAKLVADELQQETALREGKEHFKLKKHVSELEAKKIIQYVHKIQTETPDLEKRQSTPDRVLTFLRSASPKSPQPVADPLLEKRAKGLAKKKSKNN